MIHLIASDLDGTLLNRNGTLPKDIFSLIHRLKNELNIHFCAASGRQYGNLRRLFAPVADEICYICENGSYVVAENQQKATYIPDDLVPSPVADILDSGMQLLLSTPDSSLLLETAQRSFTDDIIYRLKNTSTIIPDHSLYNYRYIKISGFHTDGINNLAQPLIEKWSPFMHADIAGKNWLDFTCCNKADGILTLSELLDIPTTQMAAFGDQFNDLAMLHTVGHPYLMESAPDELKKYAFLPCKNVIESIMNDLL